MKTGTTSNFEDMSKSQSRASSPNKWTSESHVRSPSPNKSFKKTYKKSMKQEKVIDPEDLEARQLKNGRYWMWKDYMSEDHREDFL